MIIHFKKKPQDSVESGILTGTTISSMVIFSGFVLLKDAWTPVLLKLALYCRNIQDTQKEKETQYVVVPQARKQPRWWHSITDYLFKEKQVMEDYDFSSFLTARVDELISLFIGWIVKKVWPSIAIVIVKTPILLWLYRFIFRPKPVRLSAEFTASGFSQSGLTIG